MIMLMKNVIKIMTSGELPVSPARPDRLRAPVRILLMTVALPFTLMAAMPLFSRYLGDDVPLLDPFSLLFSGVAIFAWYLVLTGRTPGFIVRDAKNNPGDFQPDHDERLE